MKPLAGIGLLAIAATFAFAPIHSDRASEASKGRLQIAAVNLPNMSAWTKGVDAQNIACVSCTVTTQCGTGYGCKKNGKCVVTNPPECKY